MGLRVAVAGASGYAGGELLRLVLGHPGLELGPVTAGAQAGRRVTEVHPALTPLHGTAFAATTPEVLGAADVAFLALPHGESAALAAALPADQLVVDLGADFRLQDPVAWERFYGSAHAGTWTYGLPELPGARERIAGTRRVANPGCYVTAVTLALAPLLADGLVQGEDLVVVAASGTSGAGRAPRPSLLGSEVMGSTSAYKVGGVHQHVPEITQNLASVSQADVSLSFTPVLVPMPRGILATCTARPAAGVGVEDLSAALRTAYDAEAFVHLLEEGSWPSTGATVGSNSAHLQVALDLDAGRAVVVVALDNLVKGAAGQAVQNANIALGLAEHAGLPVVGVAP
ncbi:MAG TPA: N-acetyl-gamma-glutamyl-phosphate reductase [Jiangellales bacterium]|nr:N-acetyl-gamma-glutamyl-phosphate reductase [Jiangellales bacterium]